MVAKSKKVGATEIKYFVEGENPRLLIHCGTHGDEYGVIDSVAKAVEKYMAYLPAFVFVPEVSPSAVKLRTRLDKQKRDINRNFFDQSTIGEICANIEIVNDYAPFDLCVSFHEDSGGYSDFYVYEAGEHNSEKDDNWNELKEEIKNLGVGLLNGVDDASDPVLGNVFHDGYCYFPRPEKGYTERGEFDSWALNRGLIRASLVPEVPQKLDKKTKDALVEVFFAKMILAN